MASIVNALCAIAPWFDETGQERILLPLTRGRNDGHDGQSQVFINYGHRHHPYFFFAKGKFSSRILLPIADVLEVESPSDRSRGRLVLYVPKARCVGKVVAAMKSFALSRSRDACDSWFLVRYLTNIC